MSQFNRRLESLIEQSRLESAPAPPEGFCERLLARLPEAKAAPAAADDRLAQATKFNWTELSLALAMVAAACLAIEWAGAIFHFRGLLSGIAAIKAEWLIAPY